MTYDSDLIHMLIQRSSEAVLITDATGALESINPAAASMLGINPASVIGESPAQLFAKNAALTALFTRPSGVTLDVKLSKKRIAQGSGIVLPDQRRMVLLRDMTEQRDLDSRRESLVNTLAHDLRNPLSVIYAYIDLVVSGGGLSDDQLQPLVQARSATVRLHDILETLVELAWIESGMPLRFSAVPFGDLIERVIEAETSKAHQKGIAFAVSVQQPMPVVMGDPDRLYTAVYALIDNALNYSEHHSLIAVHAWSDSEQASLSVADQGYGIAESELELIFDRFYRSRDARVQAIAGAGLGLTTARRIAQRHGGSIHASSTPDKGSTFTLTLPAVES